MTNYNKPTSSKIIDRMKMNPLLSWLSDMIKLTVSDEIKIPKGYRNQVLAVKNVLSNDTSGFVNSILDFAINDALVDYQVEAKNKNLTNTLNDWLQSLNDGLRGEVPVGVKALAKEYFRERWKGSSFLLLRTFWEKKDGFYLPTVLYFIDGEDIVVENKSKNRTLNDKKYSLRISKDKTIPLGTKEDEIIFIQRPYTPWGLEYTTPFLIQRGIYKNLKFLELLEKKGEMVVGKALEYLAILKKGSEQMTLSNNPDFIYSHDDLTKISKDFKTFLSNRKSVAGTSIYTTNFDTEIEHLIPEYEKALKQELYTPIERRILAGLGLVDIVEGLSSTRRESILNPKPFFAEVETGITEFKSLLIDIIATIADKNKSIHRKYFRNNIKIQTPLITDRIDSRLMGQLRAGYDRGVISKRTYAEILNIDFDVELDRRRKEKEYLDDLYPPVTQNVEKDPDAKTNTKNNDKPNKDDIPDDKKGPEAKNFNSSKIFGEPKDPRDFEQAPYTKENYPKQLDKLPSGARTIWINTFNAVLDSSGNEDEARQSAWRNVKLKFKKSGDKWIKKEKAELEFSMKDLSIDDLIQLKELEILGKKNKLLDKLLKEKSNE